MFRHPLVILLTSIVTLTILISLYISGSPLKARAEKLDIERTHELQQISYVLDSYWTDQQKLPAQLKDIFTPHNPYLPTSMQDPRTGEAYEYRGQNGEGAYELCAVFETDSHSSAQKQMIPVDQPFWQHGVGRTCFSLRVRTLQHEVR